MATAVCARELTVTIGEKRILKDLNLDVEKGAFHGIIGSNGAGKTTLFDTLVGFRKATSGTVRLLDSNPWPRDPQLLRRIGIQHQSPAFFTKMTLVEHVRAVASIFDVPSAYVDEVLEALNLTAAAHTRCTKLSGGERQRLALASALVHRPEVLFLDEPTAGLDPAARKSLVELLRDTEFGTMTVLYTTHYLEEAERLCDVVSILDQGHVLVTDSPRSLITKANLGTTVLLPGALHQEQQVRALFSGVEKGSDALLVRTDDAASAFALLTRNGIETAGAVVSQGTLEDVFFSVTGREISR
ncbi:ABC transporter ATP-binding protein [Dermabacter sp. HSID17554]|uniref:ABC transporter ATP-binding protein n=1 Tax=Dermabacter sp. HSID17554 TaxID=2419511 RepID=UPI000F877862|nr:ABC transporter ATP-binding protein [Dermabacter sp. HSID17554]RUP86795.1 ABC transporter ATP-binding protein [Dermabacter sp. HSID17554]